MRHVWRSSGTLGRGLPEVDRDLRQALKEYRSTVREYKNGDGVDPCYNTIDLAKMRLGDAFLRAIGMNPKVGLPYSRRSLSTQKMSRRSNVNGR